MKYWPREVAFGKLQAMVEGAKRLRKEYAIRKERLRERPHQLRRSRVLAVSAPLVRQEHGLLRRDAGAPVVGIADSRSGFNNCHRHFPELIEAVKRGVLAARAADRVPDRLAREVFLSPTSMMFAT